ncbi:hypothetical protein BC829DRAFT_110656 [Chytridium lagenaria]|nr:hypothetical protein BC829DRAFT_110656 [Chytridium lagenaria]
MHLHLLKILQATKRMKRPIRMSPAAYAARSTVSMARWSQCDKCDVWQHLICMGLNKKKLPKNYYCEKCKPQNHPNLMKAKKTNPSTTAVSAPAAVTTSTTSHRGSSNRSSQSNITTPSAPAQQTPPPPAAASTSTSSKNASAAAATSARKRNTMNSRDAALVEGVSGSKSSDVGESKSTSASSSTAGGSQSSSQENTRANSPSLTFEVESAPTTSAGVLGQRPREMEHPREPKVSFVLVPSFLSHFSLPLVSYRDVQRCCWHGFNLDIFFVLCLFGCNTKFLLVNNGLTSPDLVLVIFGLCRFYH